MARMVIDRPFNLLVEAGKRVPFKAGEQDVPEELASHWYVQANGRVLDSVAEAEAMEGEEANPEPKTPEAPSEEPGQSETPETAADDVPPAPEADAPTDERAAIVAEAEAMGLTIDKRWGNDRIRAAIDGAKG